MEFTSLSSQPTQDLISLATPAIEYDEKASHHHSAPTPARPTPSSSHPLPPHRSTKSTSHKPSSRSTSRPSPLPLHATSRHTPSGYHSRPQSNPSLCTTLRPWTPVILYALTTLAFLVAIALYRTELFALLDELSFWLRADESYGHAVLFALIFLTTIPPFPLYSTLIILSGYTFGTWAGAIISYFAALLGALVVFIASRMLFRESIGKWLDSYTGIKRVVRAIEKRPKLLFLIRLAPYPYNVMNCLLAASPTLTLHTYTVCTALSLFKVVIHTSIGASIHSFRDYHVSDPDSVDDESNTDTIARTWSIFGIFLCLAILVYLSIVARRAVDEELDEDISPQNSEETESFLSSSSDLESGLPHPSLDHGRLPMAEIPFRTHTLVTSPYRAPLPLEHEPTRASSGRWS